jgi:murE/murF fusion protein
MLLKDYIPKINKKFKNFSFSGISFDSAKVKKNDIFFAIKGNNFDGNNFTSAAIKKGCKIIVSEKKTKQWINGILFIHTNNVRKLLAEVSFKIYKKIPKNLIAVTGTNGKSSIANFYYQILKFNNKKVASIGTLGVKSNKTNYNLSNTTIDPLQLGKIFEKLKKNRIDDVIIEASSHGLKQNRLDGLKFTTGIFTNFSQDHLDYHKNLRNYLKAKLYLFENLLKKSGNIITDNKIPEFAKIKKIGLSKGLSLHTINNDNEDFKVLSHRFKGDSQELSVECKGIIQKINLKLIGKIQLKNVLMAMTAALKSNIGLREILKVVPKLCPVEGRFEKIGKIKNQSKVILDYAHTPEALKTCLLNLKEQFPNKKIKILFGCGGNRDQNKRFKMGKIAENNSDEIYLTDDNPRHENPDEIRNDIKNGIKRKKVIEIANRSKAILKAISDLNSGEILLVAGKGHEKVQDIGKRKIYFSDKKIILKGIKIKNLYLSKNLKINILKEVSKNKKFQSSIILRHARINSKEVKKNDIFFAIKGKKNDGNKFLKDSFKRGASLAVVNKIQNNLNKNRQIKVTDSLKFLTDTSKIFRENISTKIIAITGSCGKTTLKELLGNSLKKNSKVSISQKSFNNKYGVPLSLFNLNQNDDYGILEVGMDKKGEIDYLSKIIRPDISVITNISYAHAKNFRNINQIALAKSEIIQNTRPKGYVVLNADDRFFKLHKRIALKNNLNIVSFGIQNPKSDIKFINLKRNVTNYQINIKFKNCIKIFLVSNDFKNNIFNILAALAVMSINTDILNLSKTIFKNFQTPEGRGDISKIKTNNKYINLIDESYNSNPLSLKSAILNYSKINSHNSKKYILLGDMLELGKHSKRLHLSIAPILNKSKIDKVFVKGKNMSAIFRKLSKFKKGRILFSNLEIIELIKNDLNNNDYLMVKASNATGFNSIVKDLKGVN